MVSCRCRYGGKRNNGIWDTRHRWRGERVSKTNSAGGSEIKSVNPPTSIGDEIELLVNQIDALAETLPLANVAIQGVLVTSGQQLARFLKEECSVIGNDGKQTSYSIDGAQYLQFQRFVRRVHKAGLAMTLVPRGLLVALVSQFDAYVGGLIRQLFKMREEIITASERNLTLSELIQFKSIDDAKEYIVGKEIESVLRESHTEQFAWLEAKFNLPLRKDLPVWPTFIEVTERRNLFVHTNGIVSHQYLEVCRKHGCKIPADICLGQSLPLTREYFQAAYECLFEIGVKLGQVLWRKIQSSDMVKADSNLVFVTYNLIAEGRYQLARVLLDFATETLKTYSSETYRLTFIVNRAQAYKWSGEEGKCADILNGEDWSATSSKFKLACAVLRDAFKQATEIVKQIGREDPELTKNTYREWPLFKELRKLPEFGVLFENMFGEALNRFVVQDPPADDSSAPVN